MKPLSKPLAQRRAVQDAPLRTERKLEAGGFPAVRMRRNRRSKWSRRLVAENVLTPADLIWPIFVTEGRGKRVPVDSMPGVAASDSSTWA